jgi:ribosomal RNA-processing protein 17
MLRERALQNAAQVEQAYGAILGAFQFHFSAAIYTHWLVGDAEDEEEWTGIGNSTPDNQQCDEEYEDEEILATVTIVEDFDPDSIIHGPSKTDIPTAASLPRSEPKSLHPPPQAKSLQKPTNRKRPRNKRIRYETKDARRREQTKQRARRTEKAELAGGKASRKSTHGGKRKNSSRR